MFHPAGSRMLANYNLLHSTLIPSACKEDRTLLNELPTEVDNPNWKVLGFGNGDLSFDEPASQPRSAFAQQTFDFEPYDTR